MTRLQLMWFWWAPILTMLVIAFTAFPGIIIYALVLFVLGAVFVGGLKGLRAIGRWFTNGRTI